MTFALRNSGKPWTEADFMRIRLGYGKADWCVISRQLGRTERAVRVCAGKIGIINRPKRPARSRYVAILAEECAKDSLDLQRALNGLRKRRYAQARWRAWARLREQKYSLPGIGMVAGGLHHTTIMSGIRRLKVMGAMP